jgi:hypothetical protein
MKHLISIVLFLTFGSATFKDNNVEKLGLTEVSKIISTSFKGGNSDLLSSCLDSEIELIIDGEKIEFQKLPSNQAKNILNSFFRKNPPLSFSYVYQGNSSSELKYSIGNYRSKNSDYFVYMLIKKTKNNQYLINTLQLKKG